jgi:hypothetical protein
MHSFHFNKVAYRANYDGIDWSKSKPKAKTPESESKPMQEIQQIIKSCLKDIVPSNTK